MASTWTPQPAGLQAILQVIHDSTKTEDREIQRDVTLRLSNFANVPDYIAYLVHILAKIPNEQDRIRSIAGYLLKNNARLVHKSSPDAVSYVKTSILSAFNDSSVMVRNAAGQVIVALLGVLEPQNWPEVLGELMHGLDSPNHEAVETAFSILEKACEDYPRKLEVEINGNRPIDYLIPKFLALSEHPHPKIRSHAISCLSQFVPIESQALYAQMDAFLACLFKRASDEDHNVRRNVCSALVLILASRPDKLVPEMHNVAEYMLYSTQDPNEALALEACEFWLTFAEDPDLANALKPLLPKVAPVLLQSMVYGEEDLMWLDGDEDDAAVPDKDSEIKPKFYASLRAHALEHGDAAPPPDPSSKEFQGDEDDEDENDDDLLDEEISTEWNLRKCAAAAMDVLAVRFGADLLGVLLPHLKEKLWSTDWLQRECGILALGALAEGCFDAIEPHLPSLIPYLVNMLNDGKPLVRSITCWTLGRYAAWCTQTTTEEHTRAYFIPTMEGLLRMVLDNNKRVQEAGCSAFATLEEDAGRELIPFLDPVLVNLVHAFEKYQTKNLLILYDAIGTLADAVGDALREPRYISILMPPLTQKWSKLKDDDMDLVPLLECLASITMATGPAFLPYAPPVFERAVRIVHQSLLQYQMYQQNPELEEPEKSFLIVALDLLSGLTQGLGMGIQPFLENSQPPLMHLISACLKFPHAPVRQSAYALIGDMAVTAFDLLRPYVGVLMPDLIGQLEGEPRFEFISACNNAAWSAGEIALRYGPDPEFQQWVPLLIERLIPILTNPRSPKSLSENAAVTIGRIGLVHPKSVAPALESFASSWCQALFEIKDNEEKDSAFRGFCTMVNENPAGISKSFLWFANAIARWSTPSPELDAMFRQLLHNFKHASEGTWDAQMSQYPPAITERLRARYGV